MSVTAFPYIVGWDRLVTECEKHQDSEFFSDMLEQFDDEAVGDDGTINEDYFDGAEHWLFPTGWNSTDWNNWNAACEAGQAYDKIRAELSEATRNACDKWFGAFFWANESFSSKRDLPAIGAGRDEETFAITLSPSSVQEYLQLGKALPLDELKTPIEKVARPESWIENFDDFQEYVLGWRGMLEDAADKSAGLVITVA